ncbi:YceD family protein [Robiginitalea sp.]|uniref:YceD family protein n=2 Tax=Robiginitalea sp. TaxID=1902411 RepID=UPI003C75C28F
MEKEMRHKEFEIPFSGLKLGKHQFDFQIDNAFFDSYQYDEFNEAGIKVTAILHKMNTMMELELKAKGWVNVACDLTSEPFNQPIESELELVVKFGEEFNDEDDEILVLPLGSHQFNIAQYIYEMLVLAVPSKRVHPGIAEGTLDSEILKKLEELQPKEVKNEENEIDPRWDALKSLLIDKKQ